MIVTARLRPIAVIAAVGSVALLCGCTRTVDSPSARPEALAAPISTLQAPDLLGPNVEDGDGNLFTTVEPQRCSGLAREVEPPFLHDHAPMATDGGHWITPDGATYVEEMVAVFRFDFDAAATLAAARATLADCADTPLAVTTMRGRTYEFTAAATPGEPPKDSLLWSLRAIDWNCDNALVAAHNAAIEITTCGPVPGFDTASLAQQARDRIEALANTTA
ncbi:sensor domain-containing protein [Mycobacterium sp. pV006]|uniref:sensor domain-containing protein n=1 Tax=Mycobacterium sp. pV006 TaxID=3238983 RepID=UPI00351B5A11